MCVCVFKFCNTQPTVHNFMGSNCNHFLIWINIPAKNIIDFMLPLFFYSFIIIWCFWVKVLLYNSVLFFSPPGIRHHPGWPNNIEIRPDNRCCGAICLAWYIYHPGHILTQWVHDGRTNKSVIVSCLGQTHRHWGIPQTFDGQVSDGRV